MLPTPVPTRVAIVFRPAIRPSRTWILGIGSGSDRAELLAVEAARDDVSVEQPLPVVAMRVAPSALTASSTVAPAYAGDCTCPEYCDRDHANE